MEALPVAKLDVNACKACRTNTEKKLKPDEISGKDSFDLGGNAKEFKGMIGDGKDIDTEECTKLSWTGTPKDLIIFLLVDGFNTNKAHPILDANLVKVGLHLRADKKHHNIF